MNINQMTNEEIRQRGMEALSNALGAAGVVRFLQLFDHGRGNWTQERAAILEDDVRTAAERIRRKAQAPSDTGRGGG